MPEGRGIKVPRSPTLLGLTPGVASRHRASRHVIPSLPPFKGVPERRGIQASVSMPAAWPCLVYALFMPSIWVVCTLYGVECDMRAAMSCQRWPVRWRASVTAVFLSFLHDEKGPKNLGRHQGPTALGNRPSPMSAVALAPNPVGLWRSHTLPTTYPTANDNKRLQSTTNV